MTRRLRTGTLAVIGVGAALVGLALPAEANGRHASMAIDANTGRVLHEQAADDLRFPASLTKAMTLYLMFELMEQGRLTPSTRIKISENAADTAPSRLGVPEGHDIALIDAIRAIVVKSANDVSVAVAEHIAGSEEKFAQLMTRKARQIGMSKTTFRNAHGLPDPGQQTTARDMLTLAMRLADDFPSHYKYFSTRSFTWNGVSHRNHNTMLATYDGMEGIKTGYISASGFNLVASVRRDGKHVVAVVFGGSSAAARNVYMRAILDRSLRRASTERTREKPRLLVSRSDRRQQASADARQPRLVEPVRPAPAPAKPAGSGGPARAETAGPGDSGARPMLAAPRPHPGRTPDPADPAARTAEEPGAAAHAPAPAPQIRLAAAALPGVPRPAAVRLPSSLQAQAESIARGDESASEAPHDVGQRMGTFAAPGLARPASPPEPAVAALRTVPGSAAPAVGKGSGVVTIQVGAYASEAEASRRLAAARERAATRLGVATARTQPVMSGARQLWRARFVGLDAEAAAAACTDLRRHQIDCLIVRD